MKLSPSFDLEEFLRSEIATRLGRDIIPTEDQKDNLALLCILVLQPIRDQLRVPVVVLSGLRPPWLNMMAGGSKTSAHMDGRAADIIVPGMTPLEVCNFIKGHLDLPIDQLIYEGKWTHVGITALDQQPRRQLLTARFTGGIAHYETGIHA